MALALWAEWTLIAGMRCVCGVVLLAVMLGVDGCAHLGPGGAPSATGGGVVAEGPRDLSLENKRLKQELALARKESDTLRTALEQGGSPAGAPELARQLKIAVRELADLRASYARLEAERAKAAEAAKVGAPARDEQRTGGQRPPADLEREATQLRAEIGQLRQENATLAAELKKSATAGETAQSTLAQLTAELAAEKQARIRAEQATELAFAQLRTVTAAHTEKENAAGAMTGTPSRGAANPGAPDTNPAPAGVSPAPAPDHEREKPGPAGAKPAGVRTYTVQPGDTLERIAQQFLGSRDRWRSIYDANSALLANRPALVPGMELTIPDR